MESKIDEILKQLHSYLFADSQQIIIELRHYLHDGTHQEGDLAFISSKIFNSSESLLEFLRKNVSENDRLIAGIKKRIYELIIEYLERRPLQMTAYLPQVRETCMRSFLGDPNSLVKEAALQLLLRIIDHYHSAALMPIIQPKELVNRLLDEIKLRRPSASVKGTIWNLIGVCHKKFGAELQEFRIESQDQMYRELKDQLGSSKPEFRSIVGIIKGLSSSLEDGCTLDPEEIEGLFVRVKTAMQPIPDLRHKGVQKQSMKLFTTHVALFKAIIPRHAEPMVRLTLQLCVDANMEVRDAANDMLGRLMHVISDGLTVDKTIHKDIFREIIRQFQAILEDQNNNVQLISAIKAIGVFSKAIKVFMSEEMLLNYLERLIDLSECRLVKEFEQQKSPGDDVQNFKYILKKQKQLISYIESYSFILLELGQPPAEQIQTHFFKVCSIGVANHRKLYEKYKHRFYDALASLVMSLSQYREAFAQWIRKFVRATLQETLKIPDAAIFGGESPEESLKDAIQFWREWLNKDRWSQQTCQIVYDELISTIIEDIKDVNLTYRVSRAQKQDDEAEMPHQERRDDEDVLGHIDPSGMIVYHANNNNHQQYLKRLADFLELFVPDSHDEWFLKWVPQLSEVLIKKSMETPRIPRLYQILRTSMQICNKYKYFEKNLLNQARQESSSKGAQESQELQQSQSRRSQQELEENQVEQIDIGEKTNVFNRLLSYFKDLIGKSEEYQDELLLSCIDLLLQVPLALLYSKDIGTDNVELWKGVMLKALELGHINNGIAMTCVNMLEQWFNRLPPNTTVKLYQEILPKLSEFLNIEVEQLNHHPEYFHQQVLQRETEFGRAKVSRRDIANKVLDLLGKIGGFAHNIINNELSKKHDKENFIRWDPEKRLKFSLPLYNRKVDVYLDSCLPRIVDLAQNSTKKEIRIAACEFLHALIILMIGKNAQKPKKQVRAKRGAGAALQDEQSKEEMAAFAKLYAKLFPVIIKLATEIELITRQLFEPLCFQIVRWFSSSKIYEHPEVESLLDSLIEGAQNKNNTSLRLLCSNGVAEFAKWSLKQMTDVEIAENPANIKSLIRRIESNSNHPDPFKRLSSVLCFNKIFAVIREFDALVDRFSLEICYSVLQSLKMCYDQLEQSHEVIETSTQLIPKIEKVILKKWGMLLQTNKSRGVVPDLQTMMLFTFERFKSCETVYRRESIKLWENLVTKSPPSANPAMRTPNDVKRWIKDYYCVGRKDKSILMQLQEIDFSQASSDDDYSGDQKQEDLLRKTKLLADKKNFDQLTAQLEFMAWLLTRGKFTLAELHQLKFRSQTIAKNINSFLKHMIQKSFDRRKHLICSQVLVCEEDREQVTKSEIVVLFKLYSLLTLALETMGHEDEDAELKMWMESCLKDLEQGMTQAPNKSSYHQDNRKSEQWHRSQRYFVELAVCIVLIPQIFKLQLLVEDKELESSLRSQALKYLSGIQTAAGMSSNEQSNLQVEAQDGMLKSLIVTTLVPEIRILDIGNIQTRKAHIYSPRLLMILCLGFLKLSEIDASLKQYLLQQVSRSGSEDAPSLKDVIELWLSCDSPFENESGRVLIKFMSKLRIPNKVILEWITQKNANAVYHKCNDILLQYIAERWSDHQEPEEECQQPEERKQASPGKPEGQSLAMEADDNDQMIPASQREHLIGYSQGKQSDSTQPQKVAEAPEPQYSCLGEFLIAKIESHQAQLYSIFIPIIEKLSERSPTEFSTSNQERLKILIKFIPQYCLREIKHEFKDVAINQIKIFGLIAIKSKALLLEPSNSDAQKFIHYLVERTSAFLKEKFSVYVKKEVFNLISLIADFPVSSGDGQEHSKFGNFQRQVVFDRLEPSLKYVKKMHFPVKSRELKPQSNEAQNFLVIVEAFLNMAIITKNLKVLRHLYQIIRENKTTFEHTLKNSINIIVTQQINILPKEEFISCVSDFYSEFRNRTMDQSIVDNIRWAIAKKVIVRILETCSQDKLAELMVRWNPDLITVLKDTKFRDYCDKPQEFFNLVREKTFIMIFYEIMYRRLPIDVIKQTVHNKLFGESCAQNELTKMLIELATIGKKEPIEEFMSSCHTDIEKLLKAEDLSIDAALVEAEDVNSLQSVQTTFSCAAYSLLSSVIVCTQTNEAVFANFLFNPKQGKATQSLWSMIIDTSQEFEFKVQTNFNHIELKSIEQRLADSESTMNANDIAGIRVQNMMSEYLTSSFMGANEKFNQNMVFETQLEQINMKKEEEKFQEIFDKKFNPKGRLVGGSLTSPSLQKAEFDQPEDKIVENEMEMYEQEEQKNNFIPEEESQFELDQVNKHQCMKNIKRCIERMKILFGEEWKNNGKQMPKFAHYLLEEFSQPETHVNIKIFILKIVSNNPKLFKPHASLWFEPICEYIASKNKRGKGFHYFLRDLCTMLISWDFIPSDSSQTKLLLTRVINSLILISADKIKLIFKQNIQIISTLMRKWKDLVAINKLFITRMISIADSETDSHLWKMNSIEILALAVCYDIPVLVKPEEIEFLPPSERKFTMSGGNKIDPLMVAILKIYESKKKQIIYAASELLGMILSSQTQQAGFQDLMKHTKAAIFANEVRERHDVFVYSIERASREYSELLCDRQLFMKTISFIDILTGSMRAAVFKTYERYIKVAKQQNNLADINEIAMSIIAISKDILADINDDNQQSFISLLITLSELKGVDSVEELLGVVVPQLKHLFVKNKNEYSRGRFYDLMVNLYDRYEAFSKNEVVKGSLIHGLNDSSKMIRDKLAGFWNDQNRLDLDPLVRLQQLMNIMYVSDEESIWLTNAAYLLLQVSTRSSDFDRKIFEEPLQECQFAPLHLNMSSSAGMMNRSQPMTPLFTQVDQMIQASQNAQDEVMRSQTAKNQSQNTQENQASQHQSQDQINSAAVKSRADAHQHVAMQRGQEESAHMDQGFVRATQVPQFTQTQAMPSALIAGFRANAPVQGTLSDSFYGINGKNQGADKSPKRGQVAAGNRPVHQGGVKGGTQLFTISEEAEGQDAKDAQVSQDSEGFIAPAPMTRRTNGKLTTFFKRINFAYKPMEVTEGQKIRFVHEATMPSHLARQEEIRRMQRQQFIERQIKQRKSQVNLFRKYRIGELPDIQIDFKDVLMPLMAIVRADSTIATEIFVEIFQELYKDQKDEQVRLELGNGLKDILSSSKIYDYSMMSCAHRIAIELLKIDGFTIDPGVIERTGEHSMSFQTSLILLEETLIRGNMHQVVNDHQESSARRKLNKGTVQDIAPALGSSNKHSITSYNRQYWFQLIKLYEIIGNQDALHGIWCQLAQQDGVMFKQGSGSQPESLSQAQNRDPNQEETQIGQHQEQAVNLIKYAQDLKNRGKIGEALRELENTLNSPQLCQDFEEAIKKELETKKLEYKSELLKWDQIASELLAANQGKQLCEIAAVSGYKQVDLMIRSQIRSEQHWESLTAQINHWMRDDYSKAMLEKNFSYELSMLFLTQLDYDRARIYVEREAAELLSQWKNLTKLSQVAQHFLVQRIQKIYEMREFLQFVKTDSGKNTSKEDQMAQIIQSMINWKQRSPSQSFDTLSVWDDISQARQFFIDQYAMKFQNTPLQHVLLRDPQTCNSNAGQDLAAISDIQVMLHIQTAKGAFKMGAYDSSDRYLKIAQNKRTKSNANDMRIIVPIIKLKVQQSKSDLRNMTIHDKTAWLEKKVYRILVDRMEQNKHDLSTIDHRQMSVSQEHMTSSPSLESIKTVVKSNFLKFDLEKKLLSIILDESQIETDAKELDQYGERTNQYLQRCFDSLNHIQKYVANGGCLLESSQKSISLGSESKVYTIQQQGKALFKLAKFTDKLLRKMEMKRSGPAVLLNKAISAIGKSEECLAKTSIASCLQALNLGFLRASDIIPRMLDVLSKYGECVQSDFIEHSKTTPVWLFLRWISQIAAILNRPESSIITNLVLKIAQKYPQALYYPFKVIESNLEIDLDGQQHTSQLFRSLMDAFKSFEMLNQWVEALDCLIFPEHRFKYWFQLVCDTYQDPAMQQALLQATGQSSSTATSSNNVLLRKIQKVILMMHSDILMESKPMVGTEIGLYNRQFIQKWEPAFAKSFGQGGSKVLQMGLAPLVTELQAINKKMNAVQLFQGSERISKYSEWLDNLDCNEFYQTKHFIEIPGQYENCLFNQEPINQRNVKIASVKKVCLVLGSIRRPKKITIHGSNEKDYFLLIKGGEDLRLDQRVQQLFAIMNRIFAEDPACENRGLNLKTFGVVPMSNRLGCFEWVDHTEPLKALISKEHKRLENGKEIHESRAYTQRMSWLKRLPGNRNLTSPAQLHQTLLKLGDDEVIKAFEDHTAAFPCFLLRNALENLCLTSSAFLTIKNQFIKSMAVFSAASYLIGIGDRHLENFLIDTSDGEVLGIDFGIAFGSSVNLSIPELMPFRLTQQIEGVIAPHPLEGIYKQTMVHVLNALRKKKGLILDTCEIFVKEPLLDWLKDAKQANRSPSQMQDSNGQPSGNTGSMASGLASGAQLEHLSWYPRKKIEIVKKKLRGINPVKILYKELKESIHEKKDYIEALERAIQGPKDGIRYRHLSQNGSKRYLEVEDQVDILIELARDPNILGRTWIGWSPYI